MTKLVFLGTANAVADAHHENTHFAIKGENRFILVDCVGSPIVRLEKAGLNYLELSDLVLTHFHPDHVSGVPLLLMDMWLLGRRHLLNVYGLHTTLDYMEKLMGFYEWETWPDFFPVAFHRLPAENMTLALEDDQFRIHTSPVRHMVPAMGVRIEMCKNNKAMAYSCDTEPCPEVEELASGVDILLHEAHGAAPGHTSASQAGEVAQRAGAKSLYLIHYNVRSGDPTLLVSQAQQTFDGPVALAEDLMEIEL